MTWPPCRWDRAPAWGHPFGRNDRTEPPLEAFQVCLSTLRHSQQLPVMLLRLTPFWRPQRDVAGRDEAIAEKEKRILELKHSTQASQLAWLGW